MKTRMTLALLCVAAAAFATPASANWFHNTYQNINRNVGSAPNPTPADLREMRQPLVAKDEEKDAGKSANTAQAPSTPAQGGSVATVATAAPSR